MRERLIVRGLHESISKLRESDFSRGLNVQVEFAQGIISVGRARFHSTDSIYCFVLFLIKGYTILDT